MQLEVKSELAGSVWSHVTAVGQQVNAGATLIVLECMKMELPVEAPVTAVVTWLRPCAEIVEVGDVVATLEVP